VPVRLYVCHTIHRLPALTLPELVTIMRFFSLAITARVCSSTSLMATGATLYSLAVSVISLKSGNFPSARIILNLFSSGERRAALRAY